MLDASLRRPRLAPSARSVARKPRDPAGEAAKRRAAPKSGAALVSDLCVRAHLVFDQAVRVLRMVSETGERKRNVLLALAQEETIAGLIRAGALRKVGSKRGTKWGFGTLARLPADEQARIQRALGHPPAKARHG